MIAPRRAFQTLAIAGFVLLAGCKTADEKAAEARPARKSKRDRWTRSSVEVHDAEMVRSLDFHPPERTSSIVFAGSVMPGHRLAEQIEERGEAYPYAGVGTLISEASLALVSLETPVVARAGNLPGLRHPYKVGPERLAPIKAAGFDLVGLANDHFGDCGVPGMEETLGFLRAESLPYVGAGASLAEARSPKILDVDGTRIAVVSIVSPEAWFPGIAEDERQGAFAEREKAMEERLAAREERAGVFVADAQQLSTAVRSAAAQADFVIVYAHWGVRYHRPVHRIQRELAHAAIDAGASLVVGHHNHLWQPVERYGDGVIVYGLGNFAFGSANKRADEGLIARALLEGGRLRAVEFFGLYTKNGDEKVRYQVKLLKGRSAESMLGRLASMSRPLRAEIEARDGVGYLDLSRPPGPAPMPASDPRVVAEAEATDEEEMPPDEREDADPALVEREG